MPIAGLLQRANDVKILRAGNVVNWQRLGWGRPLSGLLARPGAARPGPLGVAQGIDLGPS
jgi:hypothetical protein